MIARLELPAPGGFAIFLARPETFGVKAEEYKLSQTPYGLIPLPPRKSFTFVHGWGRA